MIIIPDIHGRTFWKEAIKERKFGEQIIFLGDYIDPYPGEIDSYTQECITKESALNNFKEIIEFAQNDKDVILLLGNHDVEYLFEECYPCRMDENNKEEISDLFKNNKSLFKLSHVQKKFDKTFLFTHAGISPKFLIQNKILEERIEREKIKELFNDTMFNDEDFINFANKLNEMWYTNNVGLGKILGQIGVSRGGRGYGSPVWEDWYELSSNFNDYIKDSSLYQIVGHSQYNAKLFLRNEDNMACLDCRAAFRLYYFENEKVDFIPLTNIEIVRYEN